MSWKNVPICDEHWNEEEGDRMPVRMKAPPEWCYRCGRLADIYVRRQVGVPGPGGAWRCQ